MGTGAGLQGALALGTAKSVATYNQRELKRPKSHANTGKGATSSAEMDHGIAIGKFGAYEEEGEHGRVNRAMLTTMRQNGNPIPKPVTSKPQDGPHSPWKES